MIELERHIEILLLSNDCVIVPDFGGFMAHHADARYDGRDNMFLPPLRTIGFNPQLTMNDSLLALSYVEAYDISYPDALQRIAADVNEIRSELEQHGEYELNNIGTIYLNSNGNYSFEPCEAGILTPSYYGLDGFQMLPIASESLLIDEDTQENIQEEQAPVEASANIIDINTPKQPEKASIATEINEEEEAGNGAEFILIRKSWLRNMAAACIALVAFFCLSSPLSTPTVQTSSIDTSMLNLVMPKNMVKEAETMKVSAPAPKIQEHAETEAEVTDKEVKASPYYSIVLASRVTKRNAAVYTEQLQSQGLKDARVLITNSNVKVIYGSYSTEAEAYSALKDLHHKEPFTEGWITKVSE